MSATSIVAPNSPMFNFNTAICHEREKVFVERARRFGRRRRDERRPPAVRVGQQGELRDNQQFAADGAQREVHLAVGVGEDSQPDYPIGDKIGVGGRVVARDPEQHDQTAPDAAKRFLLHPDLGPAHPLNNRTHRSVLSG